MEEIDIDSDSGIQLIHQFTARVFPKVDNELGHWVKVCSAAEDPVLRVQALNSIKDKKFHAQGGSIYSLYPGADLNHTVKFITALQTISDYLDNLCDRAGVQDELSFRQLHLSMLDAVDTERRITDYYRYYPYHMDHGYLESLVNECRAQIVKLPSRKLVTGLLCKYINLYSDLQCYKHLHPDEREKRLKAWADNFLKTYPELSCWEFSAAAGSTLGIFMLYAVAFDPALSEAEVKAIDSVYFPWVSGLHILLDYFIDLQEDLETGDLNFTHYYSSLPQCEERLLYFIDLALKKCSELKYPDFHTTIVRGLLAMYLSDPKAGVGINRQISRSLIKRAGSKTAMYFNMCRLLRTIKTI